MLSLGFTLAEGEPAVVGYDPFSSTAWPWPPPPPCRVNSCSPRKPPPTMPTWPGWQWTRRRSVEVQGLTTLALENDNGSLNPKKAFQPFGPQPVVGSRFLIGCPEAPSKTLDDLAVHLHWQGALADLTPGTPTTPTAAA